MLYFENVTRDSADAYLADGLTESIIVRLGSLERIQVKSRGAVRALRGQTLDPADAGAKLAVSYLVTGSVRRVQRRLRVTVELVRSSNGVQVWANQFDQQDDDVLALEQEIASSVATSIAGRLLPRESATLAARPTRVPEAYNQFLRGHYFLAQRTPEGIGLALRAYEAAVRADPGFAQARARAAYTYGQAVGWNASPYGLSRDSILARGLAAANRVLRTDSSSSEAWQALGQLRAYSPVADWRSVMDAFDRAVALDPRSAEAHHIRGWALLQLSRDREARDELRRALDLERERPITYFYLAQVSNIGHQYPLCVAFVDSALTLDRALAIAHALRATCLARVGDTAKARAAAGEAIRLASGVDAEAQATLAIAYVDQLQGDTAAIRRRLVAWQATGADSIQSRRRWNGFHLAVLHAALGERDLAVAALERFRELPGGVYGYLRTPFWDSLRDYPPFARLLTALNPAQR